LTKKLRKK